MTFEQKFKKIKAKFTDADTSLLTKDFALQVVMMDEDCGGIYYIAYKNGEFAVEPYNYYDFTAEIIGAATEIDKVITGRCNAERAVNAGKVIVNGDIADVVAVASTVKKSKA